MKDRLIEIAACERYGLDSLTHSIPYLIPQASALLDTIGVNFLGFTGKQRTEPQ